MQLSWLGPEGQTDAEIDAGELSRVGVLYERLPLDGFQAALERLKAAAGPEAAAKLDRAPTLVCASVKLTGDAVQDEEDVCAAACAVYIVLLAAHDRGLAGYWRTPGALRTPDGAAAVGMERDELFVGLIHLGHARQEKAPPERLPPTDFVSYLP